MISALFEHLLQLPLLLSNNNNN